MVIYFWGESGMKTNLLVLCISVLFLVPHVEASQFSEEKPSKAPDRREFFWRSAKIFGTGVLIGFLGYTLLSLPFLLKQDELTKLLPEQSPPQLKLPGLIVTPEQKTNTIPPSMMPTASESMWRLPEKNIPVDVKKLTPQEMALHELRRKNYGTWTGVTAVTLAATRLMFNSFAWPIDLALFGIGAWSAERAWYYKQTLDENESKQ